MGESRDYAVRLARHYIRVVMGDQYHPDNGAEMECFVDAIIDAAVEKVKLQQEGADHE